MPTIYDIRRERFCQLLVAGVTPKEAKIQAQFPKNTSIKKMLADPLVEQRLKELTASAAKRAELSRTDILDGILQEWKLARAAAQHSAALKAAEMYGMETHGMFRKQVEIGRVGEFDNMSEDDLRKFIEGQLVEVGMAPKQIEAQATEEPKPEPPPAEESQDLISGSESR